MRFLASEAAERQGPGSSEARRATGTTPARLQRNGGCGAAAARAAGVYLGLLSCAAASEEALLHALGTLPLLAQATRSATPKRPSSRGPASGLQALLTGELGALRRPGQPLPAPLPLPAVQGRDPGPDPGLGLRWPLVGEFLHLPTWARGLPSVARGGL